MQAQHTPLISARYWIGITWASIFGTNMGDFYAHESGLGLIGGLPILAALFLGVYALERYERRSHEVYYWLCIIIMRTGATNIADYLAGHRGLNINRTVLTVGLGVILALLAGWISRRAHKAPAAITGKRLQDTTADYWVAMLVAGVFGTVFGDLCEHLLGEGMAAWILTAALALALLNYQKGPLNRLHAYWLTIAVARTTGTAIGDWLAENKWMNLGLSRCTLLTGLIFVAVLLLWRDSAALPGLKVTSSSTS